MKDQFPITGETPLPIDVDITEEDIRAHLSKCLRRSSVASALVNRNFEGSINEAGDVVHVPASQTTLVRQGYREDGLFSMDIVIKGDLPTEHVADFDLFVESDIGLLEGIDMWVFYMLKYINFSESVLERSVSSILGKAVHGKMEAGELTFDGDPSAFDEHAIGRVLDEAAHNLSKLRIPEENRFVILPTSVTDRMPFDDEAPPEVQDLKGFVGRRQGFNVFEAFEYLFPDDSDGNSVAHYGHPAFHTHADAFCNVETADRLGGTQIHAEYVSGSIIFRPDAFGRILIS